MYVFCQIHVGQTFSLAFFFTFLMVSFDEKSFILMKSNLSLMVNNRNVINMAYVFLYFIFRSVICIIFSPKKIALVPALFKDFLALNCFCTFVKNQLTDSVSLFLDSLLCFFDLFVYPYANTILSSSL